jgi:hypothetical protein
MPTATHSRRAFWRSRWWMPGFCLFLGALVLGAFWIGGNLGQGLSSFALFVAIAALFLFGGRSETVRGLGGPGRDERWAMIDLRATAVAGSVVISYVIGGWLWEIAHGEDGTTYAQIGAVGGVAYIVAVAFFRWRS